LQNVPGELHPVQCDITKEQDILAAFSWIKEHLGGVDIMINNAGVAHQSFLAGSTTEMCRDAGMLLSSCPKQGSCRTMSWRMRAFCAIKLPRVTIKEMPCI
jgi:NAD(P)-dependent dehydrogenase (short-subunit alcohol dehydrogenase family)